MLEQNELDIQLQNAFETCQVKPEDQTTLLSYLDLLMTKSPITKLHGEHSIRVGLKTREIGEFLHMDQKASLFAGLVHDIGKYQVPLEVLGKTYGWSTQDAQIIQSHVMDGYNLIKNRFGFTADIIVLHHYFQPNGYPKELPPYLRSYPQDTQALILEHGRMLALADVYDALHREKYNSGEKIVLTDSEIREQMLLLNKDKEQLVEDLYKAGILK
ncbi:MAG: HD domain-containing protein [Microgenomates group bacterium]|jgi:HD-GYP domain-containing protein (c-di-GMP phosphodiesterase class II)